jgi:hypothetical protein
MGNRAGGKGHSKRTMPSRQNGQVIFPWPKHRKHFPLPIQAGQYSFAESLPDPWQLGHLP